MPESARTVTDHKRAASRPAPSAEPTADVADGTEPVRDGGDVVARHAALLGDARLISRFSPQQRARLVQQLQRGYGNGHVARVMAQIQTAPARPPTDKAMRPEPDDVTAEGPGEVARIQRVAACADPPAPPAPAPPQQDPGFQKVETKIHGAATQEKKHAPATAKANEAQQAAAPPSNDAASQAAAAQVGEMSQQKPGTFDKAAFMAAVRQAIEAAAPKNLDEADNFKKSGKAEQVKAQVGGMANKGAEGAQKDIKTATDAPPDASKAVQKPVAPLKPEDAGPVPSVDASSAVPSPKPADQVSLDHGPCQVNGALADAKITDQQLANSNEPQFQDALGAKQKVEQNAKAAPAAYRADEQKVLTTSKAEATTVAQQHLGAMHGQKAGADAKVGADKSTAKAADEAKKAEFAKQIEDIYKKTKDDVTKILGDLDKAVDAEFDKGEKAARQAFETYVQTETDKYKDKRYSGAEGILLWVKDKFSSPPELNQFVDQGRQLYLKQMDGVISQVADVVGNHLTQAKQRIAQGRADVQKFIAAQPKAEQQLAHQAAQGFEDQFAKLEQDVDNKQSEMVDTLAQKYAAAREAIDQRVQEMKDANKDLLDAAKDKINGVIDTIKNLKDMLVNVLAKAQSAIDKIIADPIGFLGNLASAVKMGLNQFVANIGKHLKAGLMGWLFGALADAGIQMPDSFDLKGILSLVLQVLGLTWANIRARAAKILGEEVVAKLEQVFEVFKIMATEGVGGLIKFIQDKFESLKEGVMSAIQDWVITKVITAGITWIISLLNPASAFVKACKAIYDIIMFFVERGQQIMSLVNAILDGVIAIANGSLSSAADLVEQSLAKAVPVAISFLASLLGLGGISEQIKKIIESIQAPINSLIDTVIGGAAKYAKKFLGPLLAKVKGGVDWAKKKATQAKDYAVGKAKQAGQWAKNKLTGGKGDTTSGAGKGKSEPTHPADQHRLQQGLAAAKAAVDQYSGKSEEKTDLVPVLAGVKSQFGLSVLEPVAQGDRWAIHGEIQRASIATGVLNKGKFAKITIYGGVVRLTLTYNPAWPYDEFMAKANAIKAAADAGELGALGTDPKTGRRKSTKGLRKGEQDVLITKVEQFIESKTAGNPALKAKLLALLDQLEADHRVELQIGGEDKPGNLSLIEGDFNVDIGIHQIREAVRKRDPDLVIHEVVINAPASAASKKVTRPTGAAYELYTELLKLAKGAEKLSIHAWFY